MRTFHFVRHCLRGRFKNYNIPCETLMGSPSARHRWPEGHPRRLRFPSGYGKPCRKYRPDILHRVENQALPPALGSRTSGHFDEVILEFWAYATWALRHVPIMSVVTETSGDRSDRFSPS
ncbi:uncharacterized protein LOC116840741 [Odontomachus brunneus]|uniref:uncharacterized protein LOC116840741 n=1 Tax=Odontomachus brunneus TaxID=486640 RepID=UPI0013F2A82A|nr:uncharacterized protein LOC116840741 [Odontomachus brunneus]